MVPTTTRARYYSPFDMFRDFDRMLSRSNGGEEPDLATAAYPVDVREQDTQVIVEAELPGFRNEEIEVNIEQGMLSIEATRTPEEQQGETHLNERRYNRVSRRFSLPSTVDPNNVDAKLENGVLTLTLPKREEVRPRKIEVK